MAIILGFSIGTKSSALAFGLIPFVSILMIYKLKLKTLGKLFVFLIPTSLVFCLVSPNTIQHLDEFLASMKYEGTVVSGKQAIFYTMQFVNTTPYLFHIKNLFWQTSFATILLAVWGFYFFLKNKNAYRSLWPFFIFSFSYFIYVGAWYAKFNRYMMPFIPVLILLASLAMDRLKKHKLYKIMLTIILLINFAWALSFLQVFKKEHTRITASHWIQKILPIKA
jgi:hypothetical protein